MDRRKALKTSAAFLGYAISASTTAAVLHGCKADSKPDWTPQFMNTESAMIIDKIASIIIPTTETPGAKEALVVRFIDGYLQDFSDPEDKNEFKKFMERLQNHSRQQYKKSFSSLHEADQTSVLQYLLDKQDKGMQKIHELAVTGFCTSELAAKEIFIYDSIPGTWQSCIPLDEVGGIWAL